jgi:hypothetical protein
VAQSFCSCGHGISERSPETEAKRSGRKSPSLFLLLFSPPELELLALRSEMNSKLVVVSQSKPQASNSQVANKRSTRFSQ